LGESVQGDEYVRLTNRVDILGYADRGSGVLGRGLGVGGMLG
jgi:hypothetical protein